MIELIKGAQSMLEACTQIKPGDSVLVIDDNEGRSMWLGQIMTAALGSMGAKAVLIIIPPRELAQREPPAPVAAAMKSADAILCIADKPPSIGHTDAQKEASAAGANFYGLYQFEIEDLTRSISAADIQRIKERTETLTQKLTEANMARVITPAGTNITMSLSGREGLAIHPRGRLVPGIPYYAEAAISPIEGTAEGTIVVDLMVTTFYYMLKEPLCYTVKSGKVVDISGNAPEVDRLRKIYATDENASNVAELGIGTSDIVFGGMRGRHREKARLGTAHIGIGRNNDIGGKTWSAIHLDSLMDKPTIELDGQCVLRNGVLLI